MEFKRDKEYFVHLKGKTFPSRVIVSMLIKDVHGKITAIEVVSLDNPELMKCPIQIDSILSTVEPVSNLDMFKMWTHYNNSINNPDIFSAEYVIAYKQTVKNTIKKRSYVQYGTGKLEKFDYDKMYEMLDIDDSKFSYEIGKEYPLQNGSIVKILGRTETIGYECLICSDGKYRYDRSTNPVCDGRCTGTCTEFTNEFNLMNDSHGNRYELHKEFLGKFGSEEKNKEQLWKNEDWSLFLKEHNLLTIDDMVGVIYES